MNPTKIIISYHQKDLNYKNQFEKNLKVLQGYDKIEFWSRDEISPSSDKLHEYKTQLEEASVIIPLVSSDYLGSEKIENDELNHILNQIKNRQVKIIPIIIRRCLFEFSILQPYTPINFYTFKKESNTDEGWTKAIYELRELISGESTSDKDSFLLETEESFAYESILCQINREAQERELKKILENNDKSINAVIPVIIYGNTKHDHHLYLDRVQDFFKRKYKRKPLIAQYFFPEEYDSFEYINQRVQNSNLRHNGIHYEFPLDQTIKNARESEIIFWTGLPYDKVIGSSFQIVKDFINFWKTYKSVPQNKTVVSLLQIRHTKNKEKSWFSFMQTDIEKSLQNEFNKWKNSSIIYAQNILPQLNLISQYDFEIWLDSCKKNLNLNINQITNIKNQAAQLKTSGGYYLIDLKKIIYNEL